MKTIPTELCGEREGSAQSGLTPRPLLAPRYLGRSVGELRGRIGARTKNGDRVGTSFVRSGFSLGQRLSVEMIARTNILLARLWSDDIDRFGRGFSAKWLLGRNGVRDVAASAWSISFSTSSAENVALKIWCAVTDAV